MANLSRRKRNLIRNRLRMHKTLYIRRISPEHALIIPALTHIDFFHPVECLEEGTPELVTRVLAVGQAVDAAFLLELHDLFDGFLFYRD
jgi:hypothetical protein